MADLFAGIDGECAVSVTFYLRPQLQWIPSAWKQWGLKTGASFSDFIAQCIGTRTPAFKRNIENWKSMLPRAKHRRPVSDPGIAGRRKSCSKIFQTARPFRERISL